MQRTVYQEDIGHIPSDGLDEIATHLVTLDRSGRIVAAARVLGPELRPFDIEKEVDLSQIVGLKGSPALVGRLCVRREHRALPNGQLINFGMLKLAFALARKRSFSHYILYTYDNLLTFYRGAMFQPVGVFRHPYWGQVHLMLLDFAELDKQDHNSLHPLLRRLLASEQPVVLV